MCLGSKVIKTGFWLEPDVWDSLCKEPLDTKGVDPDASVGIFLHGICGVFALALHHKYGYPLAVVTDGEEQDEEHDPFPTLCIFFAST